MTSGDCLCRVLITWGKMCALYLKSPAYTYSKLCSKQPRLNSLYWLHHHSMPGMGCNSEGRCIAFAPPGGGLGQNSKSTINQQVTANTALAALQLLLPATGAVACAGHSQQSSPTGAVQSACTNIRPGDSTSAHIKLSAHNTGQGLC